MTMTKTIDGRSARAVRTRLAIVNALIELVREGHLQPRAIQIAERADVSERLIYHHFGDLETLFQHAAKNTVQTLIDEGVRIDPALPFDVRLEAFAAQRARVLEFILPMWRASRVMSVMATEIRSSRDGLQSRAEMEVHHVFANEFSGVAPSIVDTAVQAVHGTASAGAWEVWRVSGLTVEECAKVMTFTIEAILAKVVALAAAS